MVKIAVFKWFSRSHNQPDTSERQFECEDGSQFLICNSEVKCLETELKRGVFIQFEINNQSAKNLQLVRKVGKVDWFEKDKGFGISKLIFTHDLEISDVSIHERQFTPTFYNPEKTDLITFNIRNFRKDDGQIKRTAINLNFLDKETNLDIIQECWESTNSNLWFPVFHNYILSLASHEDIVREITIKVSQFTNNHPNRSRFSRLIELLPKEIHARERVRQFLQESKQIEILLSLIDISKPQTLLTDELKLILQSIPPLSNLWEQIPESLFIESKIWSIAPLNRLDTFLKSLETDKYESSIYKIVDVLKSSEFNDRAILLTKLPAKIKRHHSIFPFLSALEQVNILIYRIKENLSDQNESLENLLGDLSQQIENEKEFEWGKIPNEILTKELIWRLAPINIKFQNILFQINKSDKESQIDELFSILNQASTEEKTLFISQLPETLKQNKKIFSTLSNNEKIEVLKKEAMAIEECKIYNILSIKSLISSCNSISAKKSLISQLPEWIKSNPQIKEIPLDPTKVELRLNSSDAELIQAFIIDRKINCICHFTTVENLEGIIKEGGILSNIQLRKKISDSFTYTQIDSDRIDGYQDHICCSINSYNSKYHYHARNRCKTQCWVLLAIKPDYLYKQNTVFCRVNAATGRGSYVQGGFDSLKSMFDPNVVGLSMNDGTTYTRQYKSDNVPTHPQAEVLIHESISIEDILLVWINEDTNNEHLVRNAGWQGKISIWKGLFK